MRILVFYQYFGTPGGSWSTRMYELTRRWVKAGHTVTVVTAPYEKSDVKTDSFISQSVVDGVNLIVINSADSNRDSFAKRAYRALVFSLTACRLALSEKYDLVLASSGPITVGIPALLAKYIRKKPMVFEIRDLWPQGALELGKIQNPWMKFIALGFEKACYTNASLVVACSTGMEQSVKSRFPSVKTMVIENASDVELFHQQGQNNFKLSEKFEGKKLILYAGSLGLMDHGDLMIQAMIHLKQENIQLIIIGDGAEKGHLEEMVRENNLSNVSFLGLIPKKEVALWLQKATACLVLFKNYPVLQTSSPNKLFDAFAAGVPVIQNTTGWISDLFAKEHCGISVAPDSDNELAKAILRMSSDNAFREECAKNAYRLAESVFNRNLLAEKYLNALTQIFRETYTTSAEVKK